MNSIIRLEKYYNNNIALGMKYFNESNNKMRFELIQTKNSKLNNTNSNIPIRGQIIADVINENQRMHQILNSNVSIDADSYFKNQTEQSQGKNDVEEGAIYDEIDLNAQDTQLNKHLFGINCNYCTKIYSTVA